MKKISLEEQKTIMLNILDAVVNFCEKNNLRYFLAYGTTIGAVRHKGYIPWDDDIDICIPRPDYEFLLKNFDKENSLYKTISIYNNQDYGMPFAKVHDTRTRINERKYKADNYGIYIDVFPLDGVFSDLQIYLCWSLRKILNCKKAEIGQGRSKIKDTLIYICKGFLFPIKTRHIIKMMNRIGKIKDFESSNYVESFFSTTTKKEKFRKSVFNNYRLQEFEGRNYRIPVDYDTYLKQQYGDYMKLPPLEKQKSHHDSEAWWK